MTESFKDGDMCKGRCYHICCSYRGIMIKLFIGIGSDVGDDQGWIEG